MGPAMAAPARRIWCLPSRIRRLGRWIYGGGDYAPAFSSPSWLVAQEGAAWCVAGRWGCWGRGCRAHRWRWAGDGAVWRPAMPSWLLLGMLR